MHIILFPGGAAGSMVSAVIDPTGFKHPNNGHYFDGVPKIKKGLIDGYRANRMSYEMKDQYILLMKSLYLSLGSHDTTYHINRKHDYILLAPIDDVEIYWTLRRYYSTLRVGAFAYIEDPDFSIGYKNIKYMVNEASKHTDKIISVKDIYSGKLIDRLKNYVQTPLAEEIYYSWLDIDMNKPNS